MLSFTKYPVTISTFEKSEYSTATGITTTENVILNKNLFIEVVMGKKVFEIFGEQQVNAKGHYLLHLEVGDPDIPQNAKVVWIMHGKTYRGNVKFTQPRSEIVMGSDRECYIVSSNQ